MDAPWPGVPTADCERLRDDLDGKIKAGKLSQKTSFQRLDCVPHGVQDCVRDLVERQASHVEARDADPSAGVVGSDYDADDAKQLPWFHPSQVLAIAVCERRDLVARRRLVLATYLCVRGGELNALIWPKIDLERGVVIIDKAYDRERKANERTRRATARAPLHHRADAGAAATRDARGERWRSARYPHAAAKAVGGGASQGAREGRQRAPELFSTTAASKRVRFHDLRALGLTWMAIRGDSPVQVQHVGGQTDFTTTRKYIDAAGAVDPLPGQSVFPELPHAVFRGADAGAKLLRTPAVLAQELAQEPQVSEAIVEV